MNRILSSILLFLIPCLAAANEIQHVLSGAFEALAAIGVAILILHVLIPVAYYYTRNKFLAVAVYVVGGFTALAGIAILLNARSDDGILGLFPLIWGALLIRLPIKRKPL